MSRRAAVLVFPGSNCDRETVLALEETVGCPVDAVWHGDADLSAHDLVVLPGGFSFGDYLRAGAIASRSPAIAQVRAAADRGALVLGICNGFQVLTESGLLPGALLRNDHLRFRCDWAELRVEPTQCAFTRGIAAGELLRLPIAHGEGNYVADEATLDELEDAGRIVLRYVGDSPNGSARGIAGICDERGTVFGLMPHPERAMHDWMGGTDGRRLLQSVVATWEETARDHAFA